MKRKYSTAHRNSASSGTRQNNVVFAANHVYKAYNNKVVLSDFNMELKRDDRIALMGPSGSGKTTILKIIAGLATPDEGTVEWNGQVSMAFDEDDLYPDLNAFTNIELGIDWSRMERKARKEEVLKWAKTFDCQSFLYQQTSTLSAGQRKRTALARTMMKHPDILLLDETFPALDPELRERIMTRILSLQQELGFALVFATHHDQDSFLMKADIICLDEIEDQ